MKGKFIRVLIALVLVLGFSSVTATPAAAEITTHTVAPFTLEDVGDGTAEWSDLDAKSGSYSALLTDGGNGPGGAGKVIVPLHKPLADITDLSFWFNYNNPEISPDYIPALSLHIDTVGDGERDYVACVTMTAGDVKYGDVFTEGEWQEWSLETIVVTNYPEDLPIWHDNDFDDDTHQGLTFEDVQDYGVAKATGNDEEAVVLYVMVGEGGWGTGTWVESTAYIDDVTINETTYDLELEDFTTIQAAITAAEEGDTISVAAGTYVENVNVDESLTLTGASSATVTVTAANSQDHVFEVTASSVTISGFTASGASFLEGTPIVVGDASFSGGAGIYLAHDVTDSNIHDNILTDNIYGILLLATENTVISGNNTFTSNTAIGNLISGIEMQHTYGNIFTSNIASDTNLGGTQETGYGYGFALDSSRNNIFTGTTPFSWTRL